MARQVRVEIIGDDRRLRAAFRGAEHSSVRFGASLGRIAGIGIRAFGGLGVAAAGLGVAAGLMGVKTEAGLEQAEIGFTQLLHSGAKARKFIGDLKAFAAKTPFELPGLIDAARGLLGAGESARRIIPDLRDLGDAAGALGLDQERFGRVMTAVTQIMNKGKLQSEELMQITEAGIPVWPLLAKAVGKPVPELQKLIAAGKLSADEVLPKLFAQMHKDYGGSMAKQSQTLSGLWSTFMDTINIGLANVIKPFEGELKGGLKAGIKIVGDALAGLTKFLSDPKSGLIPKVKEFWEVHGPRLSASLADLADKFQQLIDPSTQFGAGMGQASLKSNDLADKIDRLLNWLGKGIDIFRRAGDVLNFVAAYSDFLATSLNRRLKLAMLEAGEIAGNVSKFILNIGVAAGITGNVIDRFSGGSGHAFDSFVAGARRMRDQTDDQLRGIRSQIQHTKDEIAGLRAPHLVFRGEDRVSRVIDGILQGIHRLPSNVTIGFQAITRPGVPAAHQHGGRPKVGELSIVGEAGPELFVADRPGTIIPNQRAFGRPGAVAGIGGTTVNVYIGTVLGGDARRVARELGPHLRPVIRDAQRHDGIPPARQLS